MALAIPIGYRLQSLQGIICAVLVAFQWGVPFAAPLPNHPNIWNPYKDEVYLQETGQKITSEIPISSIAALGTNVFCGSSQGLYRVAQTHLLKVEQLNAPVRRLFVAQGQIWVITENALYSIQDSEWKLVLSESVSDGTEHLGQMYFTKGASLFSLRNQKLEPVSKEESQFPATRLLSVNENLYISDRDRITFFNGSGFGAKDIYDSYTDQTIDWGDFPSHQVRDVLSQNGRMLFATDHGVAVLRGMSLTSIRGEQGLCYEDTTCLANGFDHDLWIGTSRGAIRMVNGAFHYFAGQRWLPDEKVNAIAVSGRSVYLATDKGIGVIAYEPFTLQKKAAYYERFMEEWGQKRLGFALKLEWDEALKSFVPEAGDNDGGYSGDYLAAQSYRFAVTKDPQARKEAVNTFEALRWLRVITGIPGFPARSVLAKGEKIHKSMSGSGGLPAEWHDSADGNFEWKGDTSSDEICSHFYSTAIFLQLAAQGNEREQAKEHIATIASHLVDHGWQLVDLDGKPTRWGRWDPEYFKSDEGKFDRGLQALELLSFMKTAHALTGEQKFQKAYDDLVRLGYPEYTIRQRGVFPPENVAHFEDQLALWSYSNLLQFEQDPHLRAIYRRSFERSYEAIRIEQNPWFNFVYGVLSGDDFEIEPAGRHLRQWPLELIVWSYQNSHRADLKTPPNYSVFKGGIRSFPARETEPMRWDHWTMQADGGAGGHDVVEPSGWLLAYWMGRFYGFITPSQTTDPNLVTVQSNRGLHLGAPVYDGPPRPF